MTEFELDQRLATLRDQTDGLDAPPQLISQIIAGVHEQASRPPELFRTPRPWLVPVVGVVMVVALGALLSPMIRELTVATSSVGRQELPPRAAPTVEVAPPAAPRDAGARAGAEPTPPGRMVAAVALPGSGVAPPSVSAGVAPPESPQVAVALAPECVNTEKEVLAVEAFQFSGMLPERQLVSLRAHLGHVVVLALFSDWSESDALRDIEETARAHAGDVPFIGIFDGDERTLRASWHSFPFPVIADPDRKIHLRFPHTIGPTAIAIDAQGRFFEQTIPRLDDGERRARIEAAIAFAQKPPCRVGVERARATGACMLRGVIQRAADASPVASASIAFELLTPASAMPLTKHATTDHSGTFSILNTPCGRYRALVKAPNATVSTIEVAAVLGGRTLAPIAVSGVGEVNGMVVDAFGAPLQGAVVSQCEGWPLDEKKTKTRADGHFVLNGLSVGATHLVVRMPVPQREAVVPIEDTIAHGGVVVPVEIKEGEPVTLRLETSMTRIRGQVRGIGAAVVHATQQKVERCTSTRFTVPVTPDGQYELRVAPGAYVLEARSLTSKSQPLSVIAVPRRPVVVDFELRP